MNKEIIKEFIGLAFFIFCIGVLVGMSVIFISEIGDASDNVNVKENNDIIVRDVLEVSNKNINIQKVHVYIGENENKTTVFEGKINCQEDGECRVIEGVW